MLISYRYEIDKGIDIAKPLTTYQQKVVKLSVKKRQNCCRRSNSGGLYTLHTEGGGVANCIVVRSTELSASAGVGGWLGGEELQPCGDEMLMKVSLWQNPAGSVAFLMLIQFVASIFCYTPPTPTLPQPPQGNLRYKTLQTYTITHTIPRISDIGGYHGGKGKGKGSLNRL